MSFLEKIQKMPERKKRVFAVVGAVVITLIVVIFALVLNSFLGSFEGSDVKKPIFDSSQFQGIKDSFTNIFNSATTTDATTSTTTN
jgi:hypothetical protein